MCELEHTPAEMMAGHSVFEIFSCGDRRWLEAFTAAAFYGEKRVIEDFSPDPGKRFSAVCYQPTEGCCACLLMPFHDKGLAREYTGETKR